MTDDVLGETITNHYARIVHQNNLDGRGYAFVSLSQILSSDMLRWCWMVEVRSEANVGVSSSHVTT